MMLLTSPMMLCGMPQFSFELDMKENIVDYAQRTMRYAIDKQRTTLSSQGMNLSDCIRSEQFHETCRTMSGRSLHKLFKKSNQAQPANTSLLMLNFTIIFQR